MLWAMALVLGVSAAQEPVDAGSEVARADAQVVPALVALGVSAGFPSYQTAAVAASLQVQFFGMQLKGSWTPAGPYFALQLRAYPPLDSPVPLFVGVGAGLYGNNLSYHAAVGGHVPLGLALRLDAEAGIASVPALGSRNWAPHLSLGLSYAFPVDLAPATGASSAPTRAAGSGAGGCPTPLPPDEGSLEDAFERVLADWLLSARATYGSVYTDLDYSYAVTDVSVSGSEGTVEISYSGSVRAIGSGTVHQADGSAAAGFRWTGCAWNNTSVSY